MLTRTKHNARTPSGRQLHAREGATPDMLRHWREDDRQPGHMVDDQQLGAYEVSFHAGIDGTAINSFVELIQKNCLKSFRKYTEERMQFFCKKCRRHSDDASPYVLLEDRVIGRWPPAMYRARGQSSSPEQHHLPCSSIRWIRPKNSLTQ